MPPHRIIPAVLALLLSSGCSGDGKPRDSAPTGGATAPAIASVAGSPGVGTGSLAIEPGEVYRGTAVRLATGGGVHGAAAVEWLVNGNTVGPALDPQQLRKGDTIQARAVAGGNVVASAVVTVRNSPPEIRRVGFVLPEHKTGRPLSVEAEGYDADGDPVRFDIVWQNNGEPAGTGERMDAPVRGGDKLVVTVTPFDGESVGKTATLSREIRSQVIIERYEQFRYSGNVATFRIVASGEEGASLTYSLKDAPSGMRIDPATGWVRWEAAPDLTGKVPFDVLVSDGAGALATARFTVTIPEDEPSVPK